MMTTPSSCWDYSWDSWCENEDNLVPNIYEWLLSSLRSSVLVNEQNQESSCVFFPGLQWSLFFIDWNFSEFLLGNLNSQKKTKSVRSASASTANQNLGNVEYPVLANSSDFHGKYSPIFDWKLSKNGTKCRLAIVIDQSWWYFEPPCKSRKNYLEQQSSADFEGRRQKKSSPCWKTLAG